MCCCFDFLRCLISYNDHVEDSDYGDYQAVSESSSPPQDKCTISEEPLTRQCSFGKQESVAKRFIIPREGQATSGGSVSLPVEKPEEQVAPSDPKAIKESDLPSFLVGGSASKPNTQGSLSQDLQNELPFGHHLHSMNIVTFAPFEKPQTEANGLLLEADGIEEALVPQVGYDVISSSSSSGSDLGSPNLIFSNAENEVADEHRNHQFSAVTSLSLPLVEELQTQSTGFCLQINDVETLVPHVQDEKSPCPLASKFDSSELMVHNLDDEMVFGKSVYHCSDQTTLSLPYLEKSQMAFEDSETEMAFGHVPCLTQTTSSLRYVEKPLEKARGVPLQPDDIKDKPDEPQVKCDSTLGLKSDTPKITSQQPSNGEMMLGLDILPCSTETLSLTSCADKSQTKGTGALQPGYIQQPLVVPHVQYNNISHELAPMLEDQEWLSRYSENEMACGHNNLPPSIQNNRFFPFVEDSQTKAINSCMQPDHITYPILPLHDLSNPLYPESNLDTSRSVSWNSGNDMPLALDHNPFTTETTYYWPTIPEWYVDYNNWFYLQQASDWSSQLASIPTPEIKSSLSFFADSDDWKTLIQKNKVPDIMRKPLSEFTYRAYFTTLLYAEDYYCEGITIQLQEESCHNKENEIGKRIFAAFQIDIIPERRPYLLSRDFVYLKPSGKDVKPFQGRVVRVVKSTLVLAEFGDGFFLQHVPNCRYDVSFFFNQVCLRRCHKAIAAAAHPSFHSFLFPNPRTRTYHSVATSLILDSHNLDHIEMTAVYQIVSLQYPPPYLIAGPLCLAPDNTLSRTGKVIREAIIRIYTVYPNSRILLASPRNKTCDLLMQSLKDEIPESDMFRVNAAFRGLRDVPDDILDVRSYDGEYFGVSAVANLHRFRLILSTFIASTRLSNEGIGPGHFSHVFLVDASSATEPEAMVTLVNMANETTAVVITGSYGDYPRRLRSNISRKHGLKRSYMQRLLESRPYSDRDPSFVSHL